MAAMYGHTWTSAYGDNPGGMAADTWSVALTGLSPEQLATGLRACVSEGAEFPPSAPRFRAMCLGIPSFDAVNHELLTLDSANRSPFARLVWTHIDGYQHRHARAEDAKRMRREAYEVAREQVMRGEPLPEPIAGEIEHQAPPQPQGIPETKEARLAKLQSVLGDAFNPAAATRDIGELLGDGARSCDA